MRFLRAWVAALVDGVRDPDTRPLYVVALGLLLAGTIFYSIVEGWTPLDALYFSVTTLATVGFGDLSPQTELGKAFTIVYILTGVSVLLAFANAVLQRAATRRQERVHRAEGRDAPPQPPERTH
jgi:voltage-gated potassium channel